MTEQINYIGAKTLYIKEVRRFLKVYNQTLFAPVVTALLFLAVFNLAMGGSIKTIGTVPFGQFMASGLIIMSVVQNAFANTSSSFTMGKVLGTIIDYLMPPLSAFEITFSMIFAGITRGIMVGVLVGMAVWVFIPLTIHSIAYTLFFIVTASMFMALLGMLAGIIADTFDQMAALTSYVITPMAFLSGTFYSIKNLPEFWHMVSGFNPFFYMIDGFRFGMTGYSDGNINVGIAVMIGVNIASWLTVQTMLSKGYRIKS